MRSRGNSSGEEKEPYPKALLEAADESKRTPRVCLFIGAHRQKLQILTLNRGSSSGLACGAVLLLPAIRRAKNKRCLPGHPDSQSPAGESRCLIHAAPPPPRPCAHTQRRVRTLLQAHVSRKEGPFLRWNYFIFTP